MIDHPQLSLFDDHLGEEMKNSAFKKLGAVGALRRESTERMVGSHVKHKLTREELAQKVGMKPSF